jgi:MYXO-CTERM domain-containing protein
MDVFTGPCSKGCSNNTTALENATDLHSHELVESVTDPDVGLDTESDYALPAGWGDNNNECGEIADICDDGKAGDTITVSGRSWVVQEVWSNKQGKCTSTGPVAQAVCSGATVTNCRSCSCGDNGGACDGATPVCETTSTTPSCVASVDGGADAATDSGEDAGSDAKSDAATGADAGTEASVDAGNEGGVGSSSGDGGIDGSRDAESDATSAVGDDEGGVEGGIGGMPPDAGPFGQDASSDGSAPPLDAGMGGLDSGVDATATSTPESGVSNDASPTTDGGPRVTSGDDSGCGCRVAKPSSPASPAFFGFGALAVLGCLRSRRRRRVRS